VMKRGIFFLSAVIVCIALFAGVGVLIAVDQPEEMLIKSEAFPKYKKGPVPFIHKKHNVDYAVACTECHHVYKEGQNVYKEGDPVQKCSACHDPVKSKGKAKKLMIAYHRNCQGCHKALKEAGKNTGPTTKCNDCHQRKE
jgi:hypothetical protein